MSEPSLGKLLPNLTVTLDRDTTESVSINVDSNMTSDSNAEIVRPNLENLQMPKIYKSKDGGFATGIDLLSQELSGVLDKRAERFGLEKEDIKPSLRSLYESMGISWTDRSSARMKNIRLDTLHIRGVEELSTKEIFGYFREYGPESIEWINDISCNIRWIDEVSCARALLGLSSPLQNSSTAKDYEDTDKSSLETDNKIEDSMMEVDNSSMLESPSLEIPIPPGQWRIGVAHSKAKTILLRFATKDDKKLPGAEKRSNYYKKYGNPNYGGLKGLISSSRKHKSQAAANRIVIEQESSSSRTSFSNTQSVSSSEKMSHRKPLRMKMYADIEEEKIKRKRFKSDIEAPNVHNRLGKKFTKDELYDIRTYQDFKEESNYPRAYQDFEESNYPRAYQDFEEESNYPRAYQDFKEENNSIRARESSMREKPLWDLRKKLKQKRSSTVESSSQYNHDIRGNVNSMHFNRVDDLKRESRSYFKRKHRSPLCEDSDDIETDSSDNS